MLRGLNDEAREQQPIAHSRLEALVDKLTQLDQQKAVPPRSGVAPGAAVPPAELRAFMIEVLVFAAPEAFPIGQGWLLTTLRTRNILSKASLLNRLIESLSGGVRRLVYRLSARIIAWTVI
jgi:hypothetical protein